MLRLDKKVILIHKLYVIFFFNKLVVSVYLVQCVLYWPDPKTAIFIFLSYKARELLLIDMLSVELVIYNGNG